MDNTNTNDASPEEPKQSVGNEMSEPSAPPLAQPESEAKTEDPHPFRPNFNASAIYPTPIKSGENHVDNRISPVSSKVVEDKNNVSGLLKSLLIILGILAFIGLRKRNTSAELS